MLWQLLKKTRNDLLKKRMGEDGMRKKILLEEPEVTGKSDVPDSGGWTT